MASKAIIIYYSQACGNTRRIAEMIRNATDYDMVRIETVKPYTGSYQEIVDQGQEEVNLGYMPKLKPLSINMEDYDTVIIGTPTWWYTMAPAVLAFLTEHNWEGKTVIPFQTHGGWKGHTIRDMKELCKGAVFANEKGIQFDSQGGDRLITTDTELQSWIALLKQHDYKE